MLVELAVRDLGVIADASLVLGPGLTALTGETGAGKTMIVEAIELLLGGRADPILVRPGAAEARVEGRFATEAVGGEEAGEDDGGAAGEVILARVIPASGRSRGYLDGRMAPVSVLAGAGEGLVDLHGQHAHQSLLSPAAQRDVVDAAGGIDRRPLEAAQRGLRAVRERQAAMGGDERTLAREADLLGYQLAELDAAELADPGEDRALRDEEDRLADAEAHRDALTSLHQAVNRDGGTSDLLGAAATRLAGRAPMTDLAGRLQAVLAEVADLADEARDRAELMEERPERLAEIGQRRHLLAELRRKYGNDLSDVIAYRDQCRERLAAISSRGERIAALAAEEAEAAASVARAQQELRRQRIEASRPLVERMEQILHTLALPRARFGVAVGPDGAGEPVTFELAANPGQPLLPLAKVASGGELARAMLAVRLVMIESVSRSEAGVGEPGGGPGDGGRTLVFDEVDAGIGGEAAVAVGRALATLARQHQVLIVTHLPQVAAFADHHFVVTKAVEGSGPDSGRASGQSETTVAAVRPVEGEDRVTELSRMLSGRPGSDTARRHAEELLVAAGEPRGHSVPEAAGPTRRAGSPRAARSGTGRASTGRRPRAR